MAGKYTSPTPRPRRVLTFTPIIVVSIVSLWITWTQILHVGGERNPARSIVASGESPSASLSFDEAQPSDTATDQEPPSVTSSVPINPSAAASIANRIGGSAGGDTKAPAQQVTPPSTPTPTTTTASSPWVPYFADEFSGPLSKAWALYDGTHGDGITFWKTSHTSTKNGVLQLAGYQENGVSTGGGVELNTMPLTYGKIEVRYRVLSQAYGYSIIAWPSAGTAHGWIAMASDTGGGHTGFTNLLSRTDKTYNSTHVVSNTTEWRVLTTEWTPSSIVTYLDGKKVASYSGTALPRQSLIFVAKQISVDCGGSACPDGAGNLELDWVRMYTLRK